MISEEGFFPFMLFLDRHHVWQSHDQAFHFCEDVLYDEPPSSTYVVKY